MLHFDQDPYRELSDALLGQVLPGSEGRRYPLRQRIGEGGQGWVFRATWNGSVDVVVKVLRPDAITGESLARFQREAAVLRSLSQQPLPNPHVVRFYDHAYARIQMAAGGQEWELPFTVLELVEGETLETALGRARPGGLGLERARRILRHVVLGLESVHARNVVHRDLKPSNVLLSRSTGREIAKVTDFGIAKLLDPGVHRTTHLAGATVGYAPPEQFENGNPRVGRQTDVFSLAAIFYEAVTGSPAFPVPPNSHPLFVLVRQVNEAPPSFARASRHLPPELAGRPDVVAAVDAELARAFAPEPGARHPTVTVLFEAIERALAALGSTPSIPPNRPSGAVVVRSSSPPSTGEMALDATMRAHVSERPAGATAPLATSPPPPGRDVGRAESLVWRCVTGPLASGLPRAITVAHGGERAVAFGSRGPMQWARGQWSALDLPARLDASAARAATWWGESLVFATASGFVQSVEPGLPAASWRVDPTVALRSIHADATGVIVAGERSTPSGPVGVLGEVSFARTVGNVLLTDVPGTGALRAAVRFAGGILACDEGGKLAMVRSGQPARVVQACAPPLIALMATVDGMAVAVGGGGFVFRVSPALDFQLEAIQTTRDLHTVARGPDGTVWCAGDAGRVLRRGASGWNRVGAAEATARVLALGVGPQRLLAFCDDGSVFEGMAMPRPGEWRRW